MSNPYWPLFELRLTTPELELRPWKETDLPALAALIPADVEQDPAATTYEGLDPVRNRAIIVHQGYWKGWGGWRPESWTLPFAVLRDGELIGAQHLEGEDFPTLRTVDSSSFLAVDARGKGFGKQMRCAILALAFGPLEAQAAITSAWHDNYASLGVSRGLGYQPNGVSINRRDGGRDQMVHLRLTRPQWFASATAEEVTITAFEPCRPFFGL